MVGPLEVVMQCLPDTVARADALEELEFARIKSDQISTMQNVSRALQVSAFCDSVQQITRRMDALETRRAERARKDAEEARAREEQQIADALPNCRILTSHPLGATTASSPHTRPPSPKMSKSWKPVSTMTTKVIFPSN